MPATTLQTLFIRELSDMLCAEQQLATVLPRMARAADNTVLVQTFRAQDQQARLQLERIVSIAVAEQLQLDAGQPTAMEGWLEQGQEMIEAIDRGPVLDAGLICTAQKVAHYKIASYGTLCALAAQLGYRTGMELLSDSLAEEKDADRKLTVLAKANNPRPQDPKRATQFRLAELADF